ncbi:glucose 1-dehydrogenase [Egibacter rhizosphaerae]|uniref:Glucose 1-dehydrogenase n=1 Tax=Egibacter rhizosphaerae TaxID=1670831 RepID=A0A411YLR2_9ACTN|nr:glucose 1-dehydrogenase [Egibacter rhizosphaerae]QBI22113.1 glucose 1-dehydrogenase [Egibacter rhizosphaerae]
MRGLADRVALVTGGASGIGRATAARLVEEGSRVVIADLDGRAAASVARELGAEAGLACDVTDTAQVDAAVAHCSRELGGLDLVHANAGAPFTGAITEVDDETLDRVLDVNLKGAFKTCRAAAGALRARGGGAMALTSSLQGVMARPGFTPYTAAKHGVVGLARGLALELADDGVRVNALAPAPTETPMLPAFAGAMGGDVDEAYERFRAGIPLGRLAAPRDIADAVCWLLSEEAAMVTGHVLVVDGGITVG